MTLAIRWPQAKPQPDQTYIANREGRRLGHLRRLTFVCKVVAGAGVSAHRSRGSVLLAFVDAQVAVPGHTQGSRSLRLFTGASCHAPGSVGSNAGTLLR